MKTNTEELTQLIYSAPIGQYIGEHGTRILAEKATQKLDLKDEEALCEQGASSNSLYTVTKGRQAITSQAKEKQTPATLPVLEKGDLLGELSFIDGSGHAETVCWLGNPSVISCNKTDIDRLISENPEPICNFMRAVIKRVHRTLTTINRQPNELFTCIQTGGRGRF